MIKPLSRPMRTALLYVNRHETEAFGVIVYETIAKALIDRELAIAAPRRGYSRQVGTSIRLTFKGKAELI